MRDRVGIFGTVTRIRKLSTFSNDVKNTQHMALVHKFGKPNIFLTMSCNPNWDEIKSNLYPGQTPQDRLDFFCAGLLGEA